ncbi:MAG: hypothetical protein ACYC8T_06500 [Myxococcaceae bacterium]
MRSTLAAVLLWLPAAALAQEGAEVETPAAEEKPAAEEPEKPAESKSSGPFSPGRVVVRGNAGIDLDQTINLGGSSGALRNTGYLSGGLGYFIIENLELGADLSAHMVFTPDFIFENLELTPGVRYHVLPQLNLRAGVPIDFVPVGLGVLGGLAFSQPIGGNAHFTVGVDYTYWLTPAFQAVAPKGRIEPHVGLQTHF